MNITLIGPRGAGKTRVSHLLAELSGFPVVSLDAMISYEAGGATIADLVARQDGDWSDFREREFEVLTKAARMERTILDCGGGIVVDVNTDGEERRSERKIAILRQGVVFLLLPAVGQVTRQIEGDHQRPSLGADQPRTVFDRRLPWYREAAHHEIGIRRSRYRRAARQIASMMRDHAAATS